MKIKNTEHTIEQLTWAKRVGLEEARRHLCWVEFVSGADEYGLGEEYDELVIQLCWDFAQTLR